MKKLLFVVGIHGDEKTPIRVVTDFRRRINYLIANKSAAREGKRFLEKDLNRVFPGVENGCLEEVLARKVLVKIKKSGVDAIIDIHGSSCATPPFVIVTKKTTDHINLAKKTGIKRVVFMGSKIASGKALIDHVDLGISLEAGREGKLETERVIKKSIEKVLTGKRGNTIELYKVFGVLKKRSEREKLTRNVRPFVRIEKGELIVREKNYKRFAETAFYPVLPRSKNYSGIFCLMAKRYGNL